MHIDETLSVILVHCNNLFLEMIVLERYVNAYSFYLAFEFMLHKGSQRQFSEESDYDGLKRH